MLIAAVDCVAHSGVCEKMKVHSYPTIQVFDCTNSTSLYKGGRDHAELMADALSRNNCLQGRVGGSAPAETSNKISDVKHLWRTNSLFSTVKDFTPAEFYV